MPEILLVLVGAAAGGLAVWFWGARRMREQIQEARTEAARKATRAVDWAKSEAAMHLERRDQEIAALRATLDDRDHTVEQTRSRLQADLALARRDRAQLESHTAELSTRTDELTTQLRTIAGEHLRDLERLYGIARTLERVAADYTAVLETIDARLRPAGVKTSVRSSRPAGS